MYKTEPYRPHSRSRSQHYAQHVQRVREYGGTESADGMGENSLGCELTVPERVEHGRMGAQEA